MGAVELSEFEPNSWTIRRPGAAVELVLSQEEVLAAEFGASVIGGWSLDTSKIEPDDDVPEEIVKRARVIVIEVRPDRPASLARLIKLHVANPSIAVIAAIRNATVPTMQALLRAGIKDVIALPLVRNDLETMLERMREEIERGLAQATPTGKVVSIIKSVGGVGATALLTQAAALYAQREAERGFKVCLFDLDLQGGNAATHLGISPTLTVNELLDAGKRLDSTVLASVAAEHASGLRVVAAPTDLMPTDTVGTDQICDIVHLATSEYRTVFLDLPSDWTNWSLSLVAQSDVVFLIVELSIASLRQAQRQLALLIKLGVAAEKIQVVVNRVEKRLFQQINLKDASDTIGRQIGLSVANDFALMNTALNRGVMIGDIKSKSAVTRDLNKLLDAIDMLLERG